MLFRKGKEAYLKGQVIETKKGRYMIYKKNYR